MRQPLTISVLVTCHNRGELLPHALRSIAEQDVNGIAVTRVVLVDDGSDVAPDQIAREIIPGIDIRTHRERRGIAAARNTAWQGVTTDALAFLDSDDVWTVDSLSKRAAPLLADPSIDVVFGGVQGLEGSMSSVGRLPGTMLIRTGAQRLVGDFDESLEVGEMIDWTARAHDSGVRFTSIYDVVLLRRSHDSNTTRRPDVLVRDFLRIARAAHARRA
ncbi:glycosyltransferase family A protein [Smaragdicoccus niigatensis]|uniref:glycosyltransferase family A protein n=1 Tax=Smaragdicoccus niigatensis TaxID=359359 RepID=UPI0012DC1099|nr:glycosyltransferase family A protein [Smaragdicoccus niigatensis]